MVEVKREKEEYKDRQWRWAEPAGSYWPWFVHWLSCSERVLGKEIHDRT